MSIWYPIGGTAAALYLASWVWVLIEIVRAPVVDERYATISDSQQRPTRRPVPGSAADVRMPIP